MKKKCGWARCCELGSRTVGGVVYCEEHIFLIGRVDVGSIKKKEED